MDVLFANPPKTGFLASRPIYGVYEIEFSQMGENSGNSDLVCKNISIHHECEGGIEKSVLRITDWHHEACYRLAITLMYCNRLHAW